MTKWLLALFSERITVLIKCGSTPPIRVKYFLLDLNIYLLGRFYKIVKFCQAKCQGELYNWEFLRLDLYWKINTDYILNSLKVMMQLRWRLYGTTIFFFSPESASIEIWTSCTTSLSIELGRSYSQQRQQLKSFLFDRIHKAKHCNNFSAGIFSGEALCLVTIAIHTQTGPSPVGNDYDALWSLFPPVTSDQLESGNFSSKWIWYGANYAVRESSHSLRTSLSCSSGLLK